MIHIGNCARRGPCHKTGGKTRRLRKWNNLVKKFTLIVCDECGGDNSDELKIPQRKRKHRR